MIGPGSQISGGSLRFCPSPDTQHQCSAHWLLPIPSLQLESAGITPLLTSGGSGVTHFSRSWPGYFPSVPTVREPKGFLSRLRDTFSLTVLLAKDPHRPWVMVGLWL